MNVAQHKIINTINIEIFFLKFVWGRAFVCVPQTHRCSWRPEESVRLPGIGVAGGCEPPDLGAGSFIPYGRATSALKKFSSKLCK